LIKTENSGSCVIANFFKKSLIKNSVTFGFESLIPQTLSGVINRRNGCGAGLWDYFFCYCFQMQLWGVCFEFSVRIGFEG
jgi:hypothetical protein